MYTKIVIYLLIFCTSAESHNTSFDDASPVLQWRIRNSRPTQAYPAYSGFIFITVILLLGIVFRYIQNRLNRWNIFLPYRVVMFGVGGVAGFCAFKFPDIKPLFEVCYYDSECLLLIFFPILIFNATYNIDSHAFWKSSSQILLVGVLGAIMTTFLASVMAYYVIGSDWDVQTAILFGAVCVPIYPAEVYEKLKNTSNGRSTSVLLLGESLVGDITTIVIFRVVFGTLASALSKASQIAILLVRFFFGGILLGLLMGICINSMISLCYNDVTSVIMITVSGSYFTYYLGANFFSVSGYLAIMISGIMVSSQKSMIASDVERILSDFWKICAFLANTLIFSMTGVVIFQFVPMALTMKQVSLIFVTYVTVYSARMFVYGVLTPLLRKVGYGIKWRHSMACSWGGLKGPLSLCLDLVVLEAIDDHHIKGTFTIQITGLVCFSILLNSTTITKVLNLLGLTEISLAKKANMTNCVKRIMITRDKCISMLKMDKFLADAHWDLVQQGTTVKHPYQVQMSSNSDDSDDETYMGYRYTTCPECDREIPNEPTKKEFAEMTREGNQRVLKAMKISYWRQFEHGKLSKEGVRTLVQAVEAAADTEDGKINLTQLDSLWKPKPFASWIRRKLVLWVTKKKQSLSKPDNKCRYICLIIVSNFWFDVFIYGAIFCNTPVIVTEMVLSNAESKSVLVILKTFNVFFFSVYFMEMVLKLLAYNCAGYFKDNWNKLDFLILIMGVVDLLLDILDIITSVSYNKGSDTQIITVLKLLRMLRFLRLFRLARVSVPKFMGYIDHLIDVQLAFGYDVGKGFVTGEQEVCKLLPQMIDNKQIQANLSAKLDYDRLAVTRQLGLLQRDRPWTAITVKTKQAIISTLHVMLLEASQLKEEGFLDETEFKLLVQTIQAKIQLARHRSSLIAPSSPETQLRAISWLQGNPRIADFFLENSQLLNFNFGNVIIKLGEKPKGIYIIVSGMLEATYVPPDIVGNKEAIPNYEFLTDLRYGDPSQDYIVSGNVIGVLGSLTKRRYDYTVRCDSAVQAYYITMATVSEAFNLAPHPIYGLKAAMWREVGIKVAMLLLPTTPAYCGWTAEKLSMRLEHSFVPCIKAFKVFTVTELMEDVVLLDGICQDMHTSEVFQPPCYIPRTAHRLIFPQSSKLTVSETCPRTKLLIIAAKDVDGLDIMEDEIDDTRCELVQQRKKPLHRGTRSLSRFIVSCLCLLIYILAACFVRFAHRSQNHPNNANGVSNVSSRCLYHSVVRAPSAESRGRRRRRYQGNKRLNFRESVWTRNTSVGTVLRSNKSYSPQNSNTSKYFKPNFADQFDSKRSMAVLGGALRHYDNSEQPEKEIASTSFPQIR